MLPLDRAHDFLSSTVTMDLYRTVSEIDGDFCRKSQNFPTLVFCAPAEGIPHGIGHRHSESKKTTVMGLSGRERSLTISLALWIQYTNVTNRRTDTRTDAGK